jgi:DNA-directed RNA polymerase specialized sigma24 family protein
MPVEPSIELLRRHVASLTRWLQLRLPTPVIHRTTRADLERHVTEALERLRQSGASEGTPHARLRDMLSTCIREVSAASAEPAAAGTQPQNAPIDHLSALENAVGPKALGQYERALQRLDSRERELVIARVELAFSYRDLALSLGSHSANAERQAVRHAIVHLALLMNDDAI